MPLVRIALNSSVSEQIRGSALRLLSKRVSEILGKPEKYVQVLLEVPESM
jgi:phenylpyruvate tautomerase PptA (4-oxalocrotonate tautomerase family)